MRSQPGRVRRAVSCEKRPRFAPGSARNQLRGTAGQPGATSRQGYNIRHWVEKDMTFWLVSDLEADQLDRLERLLRQPE